MGIRTLSVFLCAAFAFAAPTATYPELTYSTYLRDAFTPKAIATDPAGNIYIAGNAVVDPATSQTGVLVVKLDPKASKYLYVRSLSGSILDAASAIVVDSLGNAYVAGATNSPDFPVTAGGTLGTAPPAPAFSSRSFLAKLDPNGEIVFSEFLGGSATSAAKAVALTAAGQIVISGTAGTGFPSTPGAYNSPSGGFYLMELDPTGAKTIFSAVGIGGSALALDSSGNIYVAGSTSQLNYPTTQGAYQTTLPVINDCPSPDCFMSFQGANQYVTKVDPTGSKLIYSTALTGSGNTGNAGLAVDQAGNAYVTGFAGMKYPYTVSVPPLGAEQAPAYLTLPFLSKLDPAGQTLLFSVPVGGAGVQLDSAGSVYVGGYVGSMGIAGVLPNLPALEGIPSACLPSPGPGITGTAAYASQVDAASGNLLGSKFIGGSTIAVSGAALSGSTLWLAGAATLPDFPFTPNALTSVSLGTTPRSGAYLGGIDFSQPQPPVGTPQIACMTDAASFRPVGPVARNQVLSLWGTGLGPAAGASAADASTTSLGGVGINFGSTSAPLLYASSIQINFAVPMLAFSQSFSEMTLTVNGISSAPVQLPLTDSNPSLFPVTLNADGSLNSATHGTPFGSTVSVFVNGLSGLSPEYPRETNTPDQLFTPSGWSVTNIVPLNKFVLRVDVQVPSKFPFPPFCPPPPTQCTEQMGLELYFFETESGAASVTGQGFRGEVYINQ